MRLKSKKGVYEEQFVDKSAVNSDTDYPLENTDIISITIIKSENRHNNNENQNFIIHNHLLD